jgi:hypothetical protein
VKAYIFPFPKMNPDGWTFVRRGRGVPFPDAAASAFGNRRSGGGGSGGMKNDRVKTGYAGFDSAAASAFGRKQRQQPSRHYMEATPKRPVEQKPVNLELSNETLFPSLSGASTTKAASGCGDSDTSFANVMKARVEADKREMEERELAERRRNEERAQEMKDIGMFCRGHRLGRRYGSAAYGESYEEEEEYVEDENSLDYRHPYDRSYNAEYSAPMYEAGEEEEYDEDEEDTATYDNSAW